MINISVVEVLFLITIISFFLASITSLLSEASGSDDALVNFFSAIAGISAIALFIVLLIKMISWVVHNVNVTF